MGVSFLSYFGFDSSNKFLLYETVLAVGFCTMTGGRSLKVTKSVKNSSNWLLKQNSNWATTKVSSHSLIDISEIACFNDSDRTLQRGRI